MKKYTLMRACLDDPDTFKSLTITNRQKKLFEFVQRLGSSGCKARDVSNAFNITVQNASGSLIRLFRCGYLLRRSIEQQSGGFEWEYYADPNLEQTEERQV